MKIFKFNEYIKESLSFKKKSKKEGAKTETFDVVKDGDVIGQIRWSSRMRGYAFLPEKDIDSDIKEFISNLNAERRKKKK